MRRFLLFYYIKQGARTFLGLYAGKVDGRVHLDPAGPVGSVLFQDLPLQWTRI